MKGAIAALTCLLFLLHRSSVQAAPPIESCPHDSVLVEDICKCDPKRCSKPPCPYELNVAANGTDTPGDCCAIYSCDGCANDTLVEGKCPCAPGAVLDSRGECRCVDPHESLLDGRCVCNPELCELPQLCAANFVSVREQDGCCPKTKCIKCPDDSFATSNDDDAVEDKCLCYPCKQECGAGEKVVVMQRGNGFPGTCCDMYTCESAAAAGCAVEGAVYGDGEVWDTPDGQSCKCQGGISFCVKQEGLRSCHKEGGVYKHDESWMLDSCTNCTCDNGETKCIAHMCEVSEGHLKKPECQPVNCTKVCPDGYRLNKRGCKTCKCNYPYKYDDILHKYNITKNQLKDILDDYFSGNKTEESVVTTTTISTNISDEYHFRTPLGETDGCTTLFAIKWSAVGAVVAILLASVIILMIRWLNHGKKGSYDTNPGRSTIYERINLTKDTLFNNNYIGNNSKHKNNVKNSA